MTEDKKPEAVSLKDLWEFIELDLLSSVDQNFLNARALYIDKKEGFEASNYVIPKPKLREFFSFIETEFIDFELVANLLIQTFKEKKRKLLEQ